MTAVFIFPFHRQFMQWLRSAVASADGRRPNEEKLDNQKSP